MDATVSITGLAHGGYGVGRIEGRVCFVPYALPGDAARVRVARQSKGVLWGAIQEILDPSPDRAAACCPKFGACGGCTWLHFTYPAQAVWKRRIVQDCLERIAGLQPTIEWIEEPALRLGYRTRAEFHAAPGRLGFYALNSHEVVDIERCPLCHTALNAALARLRSLGPGQSVTVTANPEGPDVLVWTRRTDRSLRNAFEDYNASRDAQRRRFLFDGAPIVNGAFSQSSLLLNRMLVRTVHALARNAPTVLDLYCGSGNLSLGLTPRARVLGIDHDLAAVAAAQDMGKGAYRAGGEDAFREALRDPWDLVILDPPRTGAKSIAPDLAQARAQAIVYVSCDPATLARDLKILVGRGWRLAKTLVIDLFPNTAHVEIVCRLER